MYVSIMRVNYAAVICKFITERQLSLSASLNCLNWSVVNNVGV